MPDVERQSSRGPLCRPSHAFSWWPASRRRRTTRLCFVPWPHLTGPRLDDSISSGPARRRSPFAPWLDRSDLLPTACVSSGCARTCPDLIAGVPALSAHQSLGGLSAQHPGGTAWAACPSSRSDVGGVREAVDRRRHRLPGTRERRRPPRGSDCNSCSEDAALRSHDGSGGTSITTKRTSRSSGSCASPSSCTILYYRRVGRRNSFPTGQSECAHPLHGQPGHTPAAFLSILDT